MRKTLVHCFELRILSFETTSANQKTGSMSLHHFFEVRTKDSISSYHSGPGQDYHFWHSSVFTSPREIALGLGILSLNQFLVV